MDLCFPPICYEIIVSRPYCHACRFRKSSSPSRWLMGLPPTSPRLKFVHTHPGGSPVPRRPPRHPPSPSTRSKSLELLDQDEKKSVLPVAKPEPVPRPRSKSLDGLLDEDDVVPHIKTEESAKDNEDKNNDRDNKNLCTNCNDTNQTENCKSIKDNLLDVSCKMQQSERSSNKEETKDDKNPLPVPRLKTKVSNSQLEISKMSYKEEKNDKASSSTEKNNDKEEEGYDSTLLSKQTNRCTNDDERETESSCLKDDREVTNSHKRQQTIEPCDNNVEPIQERLMTIVNDKSTLLKAKSCGAGLDSNESVSSNDYKAEIKEQGSLLSLPAGAEPKRKRNFMDKCVNKVRSFIKR
ncbi:nucleolin 2-like [Vespula squamosa]|uniref:Nucleolin 2-like n=1 Tax=Vespula squamosa TaxID=30214 RepID=A0ABD2AED6_VESSQ